MTDLRLLVIGEPEDVRLVVPEGASPWGSVRAMAPGETAGGFDPHATIVLGAASSDAAAWRWDHTGLREPDGEPWSLAPWPVADGIFDVAPAAGPVLVVGGSADERTVVLERLRVRGVPARDEPRLTLAALAEAPVVGVLGDPAAAVCATAFPVLAAGRLLVMPAADPAFGLQSGCDHFTHEHPDELAETIDALISHPRAWAPIRALGRRVAESQRASVVLGRVTRRITGGW